MHEMSIVSSLLDIVREEMKKHGVSRLNLVRVRYGALTNIVPESMQFAFEALTKGSPHEGAKLELEEVPLIARCADCDKDFNPPSKDLLDAVCPFCGCTDGHIIMNGDELFLQHLEAE